MATKATKAARTTGAKGGAHQADYDAIIVGGGHNGLVAAAYLARSGARTLVLEARNKTGGAATTEAPWPDAPEFNVTRLSYVISLLPPTIINDLQLARHGYKIFPMGPYYQAFPEGGSIKLYADDAKRNHDEVSRWSKKDADAMPRWDAWLAGVELDNGQQLTARVVVTSLHPRTAFLDHVGRQNLPDDFVKDIETGRPAAAWSRSTWPWPNSPTSPPTPPPKAPTCRNTTPGRWRWPPPCPTSSAPSKRPGTESPQRNRSPTA